MYQAQYLLIFKITKISCISFEVGKLWPALFFLYKLNEKVTVKPYLIALNIITFANN